MRRFLVLHTRLLLFAGACTSSSDDDSDRGTTTTATAPGVYPDADWARVDPRLPAWSLRGSTRSRNTSSTVRATAWR